MSPIRLKLTRQEFASQVESVVATGTDYFDAIFTICERHEIEPEVAGSYVTGSLKEKLMLESARMKRLKPELNDVGAALPL